MLTLRSSPYSDMDDGIIQQRFASIVHQYFNECGNQSMFFRLQRASSSDVATIARTAIHPLFLRLECVLRQPDDIGDVPSSNAIAMNEKILVFPVERLHLPTSYALDGVKDFRPSAFGTIESPVASADGQTVYLRLVYSVLESACVNATTGSTVRYVKRAGCLLHDA